MFNVKWKEYNPHSGAPVYDWAVYQVWWLWKIDADYCLHWGDYIESDEIQEGWKFDPECPVQLDYSWYE
jgi:hypothetical protein